MGTIYIRFRSSGKIILKSMRMTLDFLKQCDMTATILMLSMVAFRTEMILFCLLVFIFQWFTWHVPWERNKAEAPNYGFLLNKLETLFMLSGVLLDLYKYILSCTIKCIRHLWDLILFEIKCWTGCGAVLFCPKFQLIYHSNNFYEFPIHLTICGLIFSEFFAIVGNLEQKVQTMSKKSP